MITKKRKYSNHPKRLREIHFAQAWLAHSKGDLADLKNKNIAHSKGDLADLKNKNIAHSKGDLADLKIKTLRLVNRLRFYDKSIVFTFSEGIRFDF